MTGEEEVRPQNNKSKKAQRASAAARTDRAKWPGLRVDQVAAVCSDARRVYCRRALRRHSRSLLRPCGCATVSAAECADDAIHSTRSRRRSPPPHSAHSNISTLVFVLCTALCSLRSRIVRSRRISSHCDATRCCRSAPLPLRASRSPAPLHSSLPIPPPSGGFGGGRGGGRGGAAGGRGGFGGRVNEHAHNRIPRLRLSAVCPRPPHGFCRIL